MNMNKIILAGRLTDNVEVIKKDNTCYAKFTIAVDKKGRKSEERNTDFIRCTAFSFTAEFLEKYGTKGKTVLAEGHIQPGSYTTDAGEKRYTTDVIIDQVEF